MRKILIFLLLCGFIFNTCCFTYAAETRDPGFYPGKCRFRVSKPVRPFVTCGNQVVLEDRDNPASRKISIHVLKLGDGNATDSPIVFFNGGPGDSTKHITRFFGDAWYLGYYGLDSDFILFDQRGVGASKPALACSKIETINQCINRLSKKADLTKYYSYTSADDVSELIDSLGYPDAIIYGISYGTRLALDFARKHPTQANGIVIDSVWTPQADIELETIFGFDDAVTKIFTQCAAHTQCNIEYPNLDQAFTDIYNRANLKKIKLGKRKFNGNQLVALIFSIMYSPGDIAIFPLLIKYLNAKYVPNNVFGLSTQIDRDKILASVENNSELLKKIETYSADIDTNLIKFSNSLNKRAVPGFSDGQYYSVYCSEGYERADTAVINTAISGVRPELQRFLKDSFDSLANICIKWPHSVLTEDKFDPVAYDGPAVISTGEFDHVTPPSQITEAGMTFTDDTDVIVGGASHSSSSQVSCAFDFTREFIKDRSTPPDTSCAATNVIDWICVSDVTGEGISCNDE